MQKVSNITYQEMTSDGSDLFHATYRGKDVHNNVEFDECVTVRLVYK
jgi:hypothetical protein